MSIKERIKVHIEVEKANRDKLEAWKITTLDSRTPVDYQIDYQSKCENA